MKHSPSATSPSVQSETASEAPSPCSWVRIVRLLPETLKLEVSRGETLKVEVSSGWILAILLVLWFW